MKQLRLVCAELDVDISVTMGGAPATPVSGFAAWEMVERAEGKAITDRSSVEPFGQEVPVFLDGYAKDNSIQGQLNEILELGGDEAEPFRAFGPIHRPGIRYVFGGDPEFGEAIRDDDGRLLRQELTLKLLEYVPADQLFQKKKRRKKGVGWGSAIVASGTYTTKKGDTLHKIAVFLFGDASRWREIGRKNNIHDPNRALPPGRELKL